MRILPVRLSGFGSVAMYWREDAFRPAAVQEAMAALRATVAEHAPGAARSDMPASRRGLNALIEQCRRLEAELDGAGSRESTAMHRFVAEMDAHRAPPGMWSPLALAVLTMAGGWAWGWAC